MKPRSRSEGPVPPDPCSLTRVGPAGEDDLHVLGWPGRADDPAGLQVGAALEAALGGLGRAGAGPEHVVAGRLFVGPDGAAAALEAVGALPVTVVIQPPATPGRAAEALLLAARSGRGPAVRTPAAAGRPASVSLDRAEGRALWLREVGSTTGQPGDDTPAVAARALAAAAATLAESGLGFADVVRTWIWLDQIHDRYPAFNQARGVFFGCSGVERLPASTAIGGRLPRVGAPLGFDLFALLPARGTTIRAMRPEPMGEASAYGSSFARGTLVESAARRVAWVSGTASVDAGGRVVAAGDVRGQLARMFGNVVGLLAGAGLSPADTLSATAYLTHAGHREVFREAARAAGLPAAAPVAVVQADVCRRDWLCEIEICAAQSA